MPMFVYLRRWEVHRQMAETTLAMLQTQYHLQSAMCALLGGHALSQFDSVRAFNAAPFQKSALLVDPAVARSLGESGLHSSNMEVASSSISAGPSRAQVS